MTEDEMKTKWCPAFRGNSLGHNRPIAIDNNEPGYCIGSACAVWRWSRKVTDPHSDHPYPSSHGFCGLAGAPQ